MAAFDLFHTFSRVSVESTEIENASFQYKTVMSKVDVKTNSTGHTNGSVIKNRVLPATTLLPKCPYS